MKRLLLLAAIFMTPVVSFAQIIEEVHTKNGSKYSGYISEQLPGRHMAVYTESAYIVFNNDEVVDSRRDYYDFNRLPETSKELIREIADTTSLYLTSFEYKGNRFEDLFVVEKSEKSLYAYSLTPRTYYIPWGEITGTSKKPIDGASYGLRDVVTLKNGERIVGYIVDQDTAQGMTIAKTDGSQQTVKVNDILSVLVEKLSDKHSIWEQAPLLDRIITTDDTMLEGLITSRIIGQNVNLLMKFSSEPQQIKVVNIKKYQKTRNSAYKKFVVDTTKLTRLNDTDVTLVTLTKDGDQYIRTENNVNTFTIGTDLNLYVKNIPYGETIAVYEFQMVKNGKEHSFVIAKDALPIYETTLNDADDDVKECRLVIRKPGKYYIAVDGFDAGLNVVFESKKEDW